MTAHNLTTTKGTLKYLKTTCFAASNVHLLSGGHTAFTYRVFLEKPLPTGEKTVILKHSEDYGAQYSFVKIEVQRAVCSPFSTNTGSLAIFIHMQEFEYQALTALANSDLFDSNSVVQVPMPIYYDAETHTILMTDLGPCSPLSLVLRKSIEDVGFDDSDTQARLNAARAFSSEIGSAIGDFLGRFHNWAALPEQAGLHTYYSHNIAAVHDSFPFHLDCVARSAQMFGVKEEMAELLANEKAEASLGGSVLAMGDYRLGMYMRVIRFPVLIELYR